MTIIIGVDPGPTTGICVLRTDSDPVLIQVNHGYTIGVLQDMVDTHKPTDFIAVESWAFGRGRGREAKITQDLISDIQLLWGPLLVRQRTANAVKAWATDKRLYAVSSEFKRDATGMRHARDAGRHALFCAVHDAGMPDPLSRKVDHAETA